MIEDASCFSCGVKLISAMFWMTALAGLHILDDAVCSLLVLDLESLLGVAFQAQLILGGFKGLVAASALRLKICVRLKASVNPVGVTLGGQ